MPTRVRGMDDNDSGGLADEVQNEIRGAAEIALRAWFAGQSPALPNPPDDLLVEMMSVSLGEQVPADYAPMIRNDLFVSPTLDELHSDIPPPEGFSALIIGAGISGLCAAIELAEAGVPYTILERRQELGGVWFDNRYPGAACDVPSHLYCFSFAPYDWSRFFAGSREIHDYLDKVADDHDVRQHIRFGCEVTETRFNEASGEWEAEVISASGVRETYRATMLISGVGAFNKPRIPNIAGLDSFKGPSVHTAQYPDAGLDLAGLNVVLVGNGASAMQVAPAIVDEVASLVIVQRTPQWASPFPKFGKEIPLPLRRLLHEVPLYRLWYRLRLSWAFNDKLYEALTQAPNGTARAARSMRLTICTARGFPPMPSPNLGRHSICCPKCFPITRRSANACCSTMAGSAHWRAPR